MLICTIMMLGQMEIAVPVLPLPPRVLGKAYVSLLRLPWISRWRVRCSMQRRKRVLAQKPHMRRIPHWGGESTWRRAVGTEGPVLSQHFGGLLGRWGLKPEHLTWAHHRTCYPPTQPFPLPPGTTPGWGTEGRSLSTELPGFAYKPGHRSLLSFAHLDAGGFLKPTKCPCVSFSSTGAIPPDLTELPCFGLCYMKLGFYRLTFQNISPHIPA